MAIPSGAGTEVLKRATASVAGADADTKILDGVTNHIYTIFSISCYNQSSSSGALIKIKIMESGSSTRFLADFVPIPSRGTFIWNDKFVMTGTDELFVNTDVDTGYFYVSYIDQDWS